MKRQLSLVIPVYNESGNITPLVRSIAESRAASGFPFELILVNNGSRDNSALELAAAVGDATWIKVITLSQNQGYGGGVNAGLRATDPESSHVGWIPADLQYSMEHTELIWKKTGEAPDALHKGIRTLRFDGVNNGIVSAVYSRMAQQILNLKVRDMNGLPKVFPRWLLESLPPTPAPNFLFDCQIMLAARNAGLPIYEHPVTYYARRAGVSSWSSKRIQTYYQTFKGLIALRANSQQPSK